MNIAIHSTENEREIRAETQFDVGDKPNEWCVLRFCINGRWEQDEIMFLLPGSEKETVREIARLWNTLSVAKVEVRLDAKAA